MVVPEGGKNEAVCNSCAKCEVVWTAFAVVGGEAGAADYDVGHAGCDFVMARFIPRRAIER